jgi:hypothetical protein
MDFSNFFESAVMIVFYFAFLAIIIERSLYQIFDSKVWNYVEKKVDELVGDDSFDLKPWISIVVSIIVVFSMELDMVSMIFDKPETTPLTLIITGLFISGGSTGVYKFLKRVRELREAAKTSKINGAKI